MSIPKQHTRRLQSIASTTFSLFAGKGRGMFSKHEPLVCSSPCVMGCSWWSMVKIYSRTCRCWWGSLCHPPTCQTLDLFQLTPPPSSSLSNRLLLLTLLTGQCLLYYASSTRNGVTGWRPCNGSLEQQIPTSTGTKWHWNVILHRIVIKGH